MKMYKSNQIESIKTTSMEDLWRYMNVLWKSLISIDNMPRELTELVQTCIETIIITDIYWWTFKIETHFG